MSEPHRLVYDRAPSMGLGYLRALTASGRALPEDGTIAPIQATAWKIQPDARQIAHYCKVCDIPDSPHLPLSYPHVLAVPLQMAVVTCKEFPLPTLGLVHVAQSITRYRHIASDGTLRVHVLVEGHRAARLGVEFDLKTRLESGGEVVWEAVTTCLSRQKGAAGGERRPRPEAPPAGEAPDRIRSVLWKVPADMGRRYGKIAGDLNPIHLWPITAKLFGFKRAIVHGMWSLARVLGELDDLASAERAHVEVRFRKPIMLPAKVLFSAGAGERGTDFSIHSADGRRLHLSGFIGQPPK